MRCASSWCFPIVVRKKTDGSPTARCFTRSAAPHPSRGAPYEIRPWASFPGAIGSAPRVKIPAFFSRESIGRSRAVAVRNLKPAPSFALRESSAHIPDFFVRLAGACVEPATAAWADDDVNARDGFAYSILSNHDRRLRPNIRAPDRTFGLGSSIIIAARKVGLRQNQHPRTCGEDCDAHRHGVLQSSFRKARGLRAARMADRGGLPPAIRLAENGLPRLWERSARLALGQTIPRLLA